MSWSTDHPALDHRLHNLATYLTDHPGEEGHTLDALADAVDELYSKHMPNEEVPQRPSRKEEEHTHNISTESTTSTGSKTGKTSSQ